VNCHVFVVLILNTDQKPLPIIHCVVGQTKMERYEHNQSFLKFQKYIHRENSRFSVKIRVGLCDKSKTIILYCWFVGVIMNKLNDLNQLTTHVTTLILYRYL